MPGAIIALSVRRGLVAAASEGSYHSKSVTVFELATGAVRIRETKSIRRAGSARSSLRLDDLAAVDLTGGDGNAALAANARERVEVRGKPFGCARGTVGYASSILNVRPTTSSTTRNRASGFVGSAARVNVAAVRVAAHREADDIEPD